MSQKRNDRTKQWDVYTPWVNVSFDPSFNPARTPDQVRAQDNASNEASSIKNRVARPTNLLTGGTNQPWDATRQATPAIPQTTLANRFGGLDRANNADQASRGLIAQTAQPAQPARPTAENPLVIREAKKQSFDAVDFSWLDAMSPQDIRRFITQLQAKASRGQEITYEEQVLLVEANNKIQDVRAQQVVNPYNEQIASEQQARDTEAARLRTQSETLMTAEEQRLNSIYQQRSQQATEQGARASQAWARSMSFSGLGRSTFNADQQVRIQEQTNQNLSILDRAKNLDIELYRAKLAWLDSKSLESYQIRINTLLTDSAKFMAEQAIEINSFNEKNNASYQEAIQNILEYAQNYIDPNVQLTEEQLQEADSYAKLLIDKDGQINEKILWVIDPRLMGAAIKRAAEIKWAIPDKEEFDFIDAGGWMIARTNDKTGDIEWFQWDVKLSPLDQAKINEMNASTNNTNAQTNEITNPQSVIDFSTNKRWKQLLQCGELVNDYLLQVTGKDPTGSSRFANTLDQKMSALKSLWISNWPTQWGIFVSNPLGNKVWHTGIVQTVNADGSFTVLEANASGSKAWEAPRLKTYSSSAWMSFSNAPQQNQWPKEYNDTQKNMMRQMDAKNISPWEMKMLKNAWLNEQDVYNYKATVTEDRRQSWLNDDEIKRVNSMWDDFYATPTAKTFNKIQEAYRFSQTVWAWESSTDNQALIYAFAKAMDPDSVVREWEYATVQKYSQTRWDQFGMKVNRVLNNQEFISPKARKNMIATIKSKYSASEWQYNIERDTYIKRINDYAWSDIWSKVIPTNVKWDTPTPPPVSNLANPSAVTWWTADNPLWLDL